MSGDAPYNLPSAADAPAPQFKIRLSQPSRIKPNRPRCGRTKKHAVDQAACCSVLFCVEAAVLSRSVGQRARTRAATLGDHPLARRAPLAYPGCTERAGLHVVNLTSGQAFEGEAGLSARIQLQERVRRRKQRDAPHVTDGTCYRERARDQRPVVAALLQKRMRRRGQNAYRRTGRFLNGEAAADERS
jgi:hypothetical protein